MAANKFDPICKAYYKILIADTMNHLNIKKKNLLQ